MAFDTDLPLPQLGLVVSGSQDKIAPPDKIQGLMPGWNPRASFKEIQGADHFYFGFLKELESVLTEYI